MPIKKYKPTSPGRRNSSVLDHSHLTKKRPEKSLTVRIPKRAGRNAHGHITSRFRGGGARRLYRIIDFKRTKDGVPSKVAAIEYDPNRNADIALLHYADGEKRYILAPLGLKVGAVVISGEKVEPEAGLEPATSALRKQCSTIELLWLLAAVHSALCSRWTLETPAGRRWGLSSRRSRAPGASSSRAPRGPGRGAPGRGPSRRGRRGSLRIA